MPSRQCILTTWYVRSMVSLTYRYILSLPSELLITLCYSFLTVNSPLIVSSGPWDILSVIVGFDKWSSGVLFIPEGRCTTYLLASSIQLDEHLRKGLLSLGVFHTSQFYKFIFIQTYLSFETYSSATSFSAIVVFLNNS